MKKQMASELEDMKKKMKKMEDGQKNYDCK